MSLFNNFTIDQEIDKGEEEEASRLRIQTGSTYTQKLHSSNIIPLVHTLLRHVNF